MEGNSSRPMGAGIGPLPSSTPRGVSVIEEQFKYVEAAKGRFELTMANLHSRLSVVLREGSSPKEPRGEKPGLTPLAEAVRNIGDFINANADALQSIIERLDI